MKKSSEVRADEEDKEDGKQAKTTTKIVNITLIHFFMNRTPSLVGFNSDSPYKYSFLLQILY